MYMNGFNRGEWWDILIGALLKSHIILGLSTLTVFNPERTLY